MPDGVRTGFDLGAVSRLTRREHALGALREAVSTGRLQPGTHLAEVELSASLGISRGTLREAMRHLQQEGLLVADSRGRLSVRVVRAPDVTEIFAVRGALEALAATSVCARPRPSREEAVAALDAQLARMQRPGADLGERVTEDLAFHELLCSASGNATLLESWRAVSGRARVAVTAAGDDAAIANMAVDRHRPLLDLLLAGDGPGSSRFLVEHMEQAADQLLAHLADA